MQLQYQYLAFLYSYKFVYFITLHWILTPCLLFLYIFFYLEIVYFNLIKMYYQWPMIFCGTMCGSYSE